MPLLDADLAPRPAKARKPEWLWAAMAALVLAVVTAFLVVPQQATETVSRIVQAAQGLVDKKDAGKPAAEQPADDTRALPAANRRTRRPGQPKPVRPLEARLDVLQIPPSAQAGTPESSHLSRLDIPVGTSGDRLRQLLGDPDLAVSTMEQKQTIEHFVYVNQAQTLATTILLMDGRVVSICTGTPSLTWKADGYQQARRIGKATFRSEQCK
jgi:hypothetical protein